VTTAENGGDRGRRAGRDGSTRLTISDVAREAGVSNASVSRVLTGARPVTPEVTSAVLEASRRLGFRANRVARALRMQSTQTIGIVVPDITYPFFPQLIQAIETELRAERRGLLLADSLNDPMIESERIEELLDRQVDGLMVSPCHRRDSRRIVEWAAERALVVQLDRQVSSRVHYVGMDHPLAMRMLLDHLGSTGRTGFVHLAASPTSAASYERRREYLRYFAHTADRDRVLVGDHSFDWGVHGARQAIEAWPEIDAIVCGNDLIAVGALHALSGLGVEVPEQVAVTGFDDSLRPLVGWPALTTIRQPLAEMARRALTLLSIEGDTTRLRLPGELVVRDSSTCKGAAPPSP
jgi:LacI family transcriptional regulator